jgi:hypothetical protein
MKRIASVGLIVLGVCAIANADLMNIALQANGGTATAISSGTYLGVTHWPSMAINGDPSAGGWASNWSMPAWLQVQFNQVYRIEDVGVHWDQHNQTFSISLSPDGLSWTTVVPSQMSNTNAHYDNGAYIGSDPAYEVFPITPTDAEYIRIDITSTSAPASHIFQARVDALEAYATVGGAPQPAPVPLPGAAILGCIGLSFAGWRLKRKAATL